ncbi:hypothetical protein INR49_024971 [Caranx melampygus]|nr:hypothetical protein INR49_024971 [Caranx melampygus]
MHFTLDIGGDQLGLKNGEGWRPDDSKLIVPVTDGVNNSSQGGAMEADIFEYRKEEDTESIESFHASFTSVNLPVEEISLTSTAQIRKLEVILEELDKRLGLQDSSQIKWNIKLIHNKDLLATIHLLVAMVKCFQPEMELPPNVKVEVVAVELHNVTLAFDLLNDMGLQMPGVNPQGFVPLIVFPFQSDTAAAWYLSFFLYNSPVLHCHFSINNMNFFVCFFHVSLLTNSVLNKCGVQQAAEGSTESDRQTIAFLGSEHYADYNKTAAVLASIFVVIFKPGFRQSTGTSFTSDSSTQVTKTVQRSMHSERGGERLLSVSVSRVIMRRNCRSSIKVQRPERKFTSSVTLDGPVGLLHRLPWDVRPYLNTPIRRSAGVLQRLRLRAATKIFIIIIIIINIIIIITIIIIIIIIIIISVSSSSRGPLKTLHMNLSSALGNTVARLGVVNHSSAPQTLTMANLNRRFNVDININLRWILMQCQCHRRSGLSIKGIAEMKPNGVLIDKCWQDVSQAPQ